MWAGGYIRPRKDQFSSGRKTSLPSKVAEGSLYLHLYLRQLHTLFQLKPQSFFSFSFFSPSPLVHSSGSFQLWHVGCHLSMAWWVVPCPCPGFELVKPWAAAAEHMNLTTQPRGRALSLSLDYCIFFFFTPMTHSPALLSLGVEPALLLWSCG